MYKKLSLAALTLFALSGCTASGAVKFDAGNSPSQCAEQMTQGKVPVSEQHDYIQKCSAGYHAAHDGDDDGSIKFKMPSKDPSGQ